MKDANNKQYISTSKKLVILFAVIMLIFAAINAVWYFGYKATYDELASKMDQTIDRVDGKTVHYTKTVKNYSFNLKMPAYLGKGGFLSVGDIEGAVTEFDSNNNIVSSNGTYITLFIWPQRFGGYQMGVDFYDEATDLWEQVYIDSALNIVSSENIDSQHIKYLKELLSEYATEIQDLIKAAETLWEIEL